jgi:hypothetical protein
MEASVAHVAARHRGAQQRVVKCTVWCTDAV